MRRKVQHNEVSGTHSCLDFARYNRLKYVSFRYRACHAAAASNSALKGGVCVYSHRIPLLQQESR